MNRVLDFTVIGTGREGEGEGIRVEKQKPKERKGELRFFFGAMFSHSTAQNTVIVISIISIPIKYVLFYYFKS